MSHLSFSDGNVTSQAALRVEASCKTFVNMNGLELVDNFLSHFALLQRWPGRKSFAALLDQLFVGPKQTWSRQWEAHSFVQHDLQLDLQDVEDSMGVADVRMYCYCLMIRAFSQEFSGVTPVSQ